MNMPSSLANGRYQIGQLIGRGGMAEVHVGLDTRLGRTIAIKIMRADLANDEIFLTRFRREAHSVAQMNNANIVNIYDSGAEIGPSDINSDIQRGTPHITAFPVLPDFPYPPADRPGGPIPPPECRKTPRLHSP